MSGTVLVTGASGYIAGFTIRQLLAEGWQVRGSIRNLARADEVRATLGVSAAELPLVAVDLLSDSGWAEAAAGCTHLLHIASPVLAGVPTHEDDLIRPAREGALRALAAAKAAGVGRVVLTSSVAAITYGHGKTDKLYTEADWTDLASPTTGAYAKSKTIAERAARDWMAANGAGMEFATINPGMVLGPVLGPDFSASLEVVKRLIDGSMPGLPHVGFSIVDVREVADAHVKALTVPGIDGERFIVAGDEFLWLDEIAALLKARLGPRAAKVPSRRLPDFVVRLASLFSPPLRFVASELGRRRALSSAHAKARLGIRFRASADSLADAANSLIDAGIVKV
ncbi:NAD-dependent epimerase/dehydratase family protein [Sandaracinobacter neustonicus]|uniref:NAD-dependent epimerase/dehydratase family protein n=1 Tax=Sandaracinobacter neustonicus TaxID=1715348 RepID=A0A501XDV1_9SPHN|nr:NAD-dependent epimerase/dehydratase family protein [Sandaracinobacter neustonicus]TPE58690.1 NAD-dependent epimerase/dehydratase family protein [Sandaracinobacter neustonicus]